MSVFTQRYTAGFTLIELLVVIAIIGLLASVVLGSIQDAVVRAENAKRLQDMDQIEWAMRLFYEDHGRFPSYGADLEDIRSSGEVIGAGYSIDDALRPYLDPIPTDPRYDAGYVTSGDGAEQPIEGALYYYSYDPQHRISICPATTTVETNIPVIGFNYSRITTGLPPKDTCVGADVNLDQAVYNRALYP